jgi:hypothetical protein
MRQYNQRIRLVHGSALSEMPPAMFLLFFFAIFPVVNLIFLGVVFASCTSLNTAELREAARTPHTQLTGVLTLLQENWQSNALGRIAGVSKAPESNVTYINIGDDAYVAVSTTFSLKPFLPIPFFNKVPALGAPWSFSVKGKRVLENPNYASM